MGSVECIHMNQMSITMTSRSVISVHASPELSQRLERLATMTRRSKSSLANQAIENFVEAEEEFIEKIQAGRADVIAGRVLTSEDMRAHFQSILRHKPNTA